MLGKQVLRPTIDYESLWPAILGMHDALPQVSNMQWVKEAMVHISSGPVEVQSSFGELGNTVQLAGKGTRILPLQIGGDFVLRTRWYGKRRLFSKRPRPTRTMQRRMQFCKDCADVHA